MTNLPTHWTRVAMLLLVVFGALIAPTGAHAQTDPIIDLAARINRERIARGLAPLALNAKLAAAAQAHAQDIARNGRTNNAQAGHVGSDGSTIFDRVARTGYGAYSWGSRLGENWAWYRTPADAFAMWMDSPAHRNNILHPLFREMGLGVTAHPVVGFVFVVDFGAQPNVLPLFINDGAAETQTRDVKLTLTSEDAAPNGDGDFIGRPAQVMISNAPDFSGASWQTYAPKISWTLAPNGGVKTVYVKYRDAKGRTALASDSINLGAVAASTRAPQTLAPTRITAAPTASATRAPTDAPSETPTPTMTPAPTASPTAAPETPAPPSATRAASFDGLGMIVVAVMSIVMIRVWYAVER